MKNAASKCPREKTRRILFSSATNSEPRRRTDRETSFAANFSFSSNKNSFRLFWRTVDHRKNVRRRTTRDQIQFEHRNERNVFSTAENLFICFVKLKIIKVYRFFAFGVELCFNISIERFSVHRRPEEKSFSVEQIRFFYWIFTFRTKSTEIFSEIRRAKVSSTFAKTCSDRRIISLSVHCFKWSATFSINRVLAPSSKTFV